MASIATNTTDDVGGEVALFRTIVFAMTDLPALGYVSSDRLDNLGALTILTSLVLVITKSSVERCKLTELVTLELVLSFGDRCCRLDDIVNELFGFVDLLFCVCHDQAMEIFFLVAGVSCVRSTLAFLDRAFATNGDLCTRFCFHLFQSIATRSDE